MTGVLPGRSVRDSQIAELIRGGATAARVVLIGAYRRTWTPDDVVRVIRREKLTAPPPGPTVPSLLPHPDAPVEPALPLAVVLPFPAPEPDRSVWEPPTILAAPQGSVEIGPRQAAVLTHLCRGLANRRIGRELHITEDTVKTHVRHLLAEFGARDRMHLAVLAVTGQVEVRIKHPKGKTR